LRNGDDDLGGDDFREDPDGLSGSSIQEKLDCAMVDRVGTGAFGLCCTSPSFPASIEFCCTFFAVIAIGEAAIAGSLLAKICGV
jgi:hypothetical protein